MKSCFFRICLAVIILIKVQSAYSFQLSQNAIPSVSRVVSDSLFNKGNVQEAYGLINNLFSGVLITKAGANIHENFNVRVRGISTITGRNEPLVVINGIIGVPIDAIDINDIESITILKGPETAIYGIQGASGVIEIQTKMGSDKTLEVSFNSGVIVEQKIYKQKVRNAESFLALGGNDLGNRIDWLDYITQSGVSTVNNLALSGSKNALDYRFSVNSRLVNGILKDSGYDLTNFFGHVRWRGLNDKLNVEYIGALNSKQSDIGFSQVFKYALDANPTMPKYFPSGDVYQALQFDAYNPVLFFEMARNTGKSQTILNGLNAKYDLNSYLFNFSLNVADQSISKYTFVDHRSFFRYGGFKGATFSSTLNKNIAFDIQKTIALANSQLQLRSGVKSQTISLKQSNIYREIEINDLIENETLDEDKIKFNSGFFAGNLNYKQWAYFDFQASVESSSVLGINIKPALFYYMRGGLDVFKKMGKINSLFVSASIGKSGLSPYDDDATIATSNDLTTINSDLSYDLSSETSKNSEISASYQHQNRLWLVTLTRYKKISSDLLRRIWTEEEGTFFEINRNADELSNSGWELDLDWNTKISDFSISSNLNFTSLKTEWTKIEGEPYTLGYVGCGCSGVGVIRYEKGLPFGAIHSPMLEGFRPDGNFILTDQNSDGRITEEDYLVQGQSLPKARIGWRNEIGYKNTKLIFQFDATLGHSLANFLRFEGATNDAGITGTTNTLEDNLGIEAPYNQWSDIFVEDASYLRLAYIHISQRFTIKKLPLIAGLTANNLFTISNYSGNDSSVRFSYPYGGGAIFNIPAIQSMNEWFPSRSFTVSISAKF
jgi:iron complex outermembrane receptor protein